MKFILFLLIVFTINGNAQVVDLDNHNPLKNLGKSVRYFEDKSGNLSLQEVLAAYETGQFHNGKTDILNFGNTRSAVWLNVTFRPSHKLEDYLVIGGATLEEIDCYLPSGTGWKQLQAGSVRKASKEAHSTNIYVFAIPSALDTSSVQSIWVKIKTRNIMLVSIKMANSDELYLVQNTVLRIIEISFIGVLLTLFAFNLFLYFGLRDRTYLYYCVYVLSLGIYVIGYLAGYIYLLGDDMRILLNQYPHIFHCISIIASLLIANEFYNLQKISKTLFRIYSIVLVISVVLLVLSLLGLKGIASGGAQVLGLLAPVSLLIFGIVVHKVKKYPTQYFTLAWLSIIIAVIIYVLSLQGIIEYRSYSRVILEAGITVEFLLLAFALGQRYHLILESQIKLEEENYQLIKNQNLKLEKLVEKRTEKLREAVAKLEASDSVKNKLFSIVAHDLRAPFNSMLGILSSNNLELLSFEELKVVLHQNKNNFYQLKALLDNLLHWARTQMDEVQIHPEAFDLSEMIQGMTAVYQPVAQKKQLRFEINIPAPVDYVYADRNHVQLVLRNLLDNAVKFTQPLNTVWIEITNLDGHAMLSIKNKVTDKEGINAGVPGHADGYKPGYGTANEKGVGLGLNLCREYLERNGSRLQMDIENNNIISFSFKLPYASALKQARDKEWVQI